MSNLCVSAKQKSQREMSAPAKFEEYWDMNIPTEYYEEEFLEFEKYMQFTGNQKHSSKENPHANSDYYLEKFKSYEKFMKKDRKAEDRKEGKARKIKTVGHSNPSPKAKPYSSNSKAAIGSSKVNKQCLPRIFRFQFNDFHDE